VCCHIKTQLNSIPFYWKRAKFSFLSFYDTRKTKVVSNFFSFSSAPRWAPFAFLPAFTTFLPALHVTGQERVTITPEWSANVIDYPLSGELPRVCSVRFKCYYLVPSLHNYSLTFALSYTHNFRMFVKMYCELSKLINWRLC
jgi:hypothetical protein